MPYPDSNAPPRPPVRRRNLNQEAFRLAKFVDTHVTKSDELMARLEQTYADGSNAELADTLATILHHAETITYTRRPGDA